MIDGDWNDNYGPRGHAVQVRNGLWGKPEPAVAPVRPYNGTAAPPIWFDGRAFLVRNHAQQFPQQPTRSIEPDSVPTEIEPTGVEPTEIEPTEPEPIASEPTELELFEPKPSPSPESPAEESEEASSSSGNPNGAVGQRIADFYR